MIAFKGCTLQRLVGVSCFYLTTLLLFPLLSACISSLPAGRYMLIFFGFLLHWLVAGFASVVCRFRSTTSFHGSATVNRSCTLRVGPAWLKEFPASLPESAVTEMHYILLSASLRLSDRVHRRIFGFKRRGCTRPENEEGLIMRSCVVHVLQELSLAVLSRGRDGGVVCRSECKLLVRKPLGKETTCETWG
jgi:hypothetical protein